jgi:thiosulfate dehydrogenase (quinone) large subunit
MRSEKSEAAGIRVFPDVLAPSEGQTVGRRKPTVAQSRLTQKITPERIQDPPLAKFLFTSTKMGIVWLVLRVWLGYQWFQGGEHKLTDPKWMQTGEALKGFWVNAAKIPAAPAKAAITFDWYRSFLQYLVDNEAYVWFAKLIAVGEVLIGVALILGLFTGIAAFMGGFMNWNFMMAGAASTNPLLFAAAVALVLAWKVGGYYGLDRYVLPLLGTPWQLGTLVAPNETRRIELRHTTA